MHKIASKDVKQIFLTWFSPELEYFVTPVIYITVTPQLLHTVTPHTSKFSIQIGEQTQCYKYNETNSNRMLQIMMTHKDIYFSRTLSLEEITDYVDDCIIN